MSSNAQLARYDELRELGFASFNPAAYVAVGAVFSNAVRILKIWNTSDVDLYVSFDGVTANDYVPAGTGGVLDICANRNDPVGNLEQPAQQQVFVLPADAAVATYGRFTVTIVYGSTN